MRTAAGRGGPDNVPTAAKPENIVLRVTGVEKLFAASKGAVIDGALSELGYKSISYAHKLLKEQIKDELANGQSVRALSESLRDDLPTPMDWGIMTPSLNQTMEEKAKEILLSFRNLPPGGRPQEEESKAE